MNILKFEMKKLVKQRKFCLLLAVILLFSSGLFIQNKLEQKDTQDRAREEIRVLKENTDAMGEEMRLRQLENGLTELEEIQYEHVKEMSIAFFHWKSAITNEEWGDIPTYEKDFLTNLQLYEEHGGDYSSLQGIEREKAIAKNNWMIEKNIAYEDETFPTSPHLLIKENVAFLLGIFGVVLLVLLFGNTITTEKEQNTWLMLNTQPVAYWQWIIWKYGSILLAALIYILMVIGIAILIPVIFDDYALNFLYPQVVTSGESVVVMSTLQFVGRMIVLFLSASVVAFSLVLFISKWVKSSFTALVMSGFFLVIGYVLTDTIGLLQSVWNPLQSLRIGSIIDTVPQASDWLYPVVALIWSVILLSTALLLPNKEIHIFSSSHVQKPFRQGTTGKRNNSFWKIIQFESRKTRRRGLLLQASIVMILLMIFGNFIFSHQADKNERYYMDMLNKGIEIDKAQLNFFEEDTDYIEKLDIDEENRKELIEQNKEFRNFYQENISMANDAIKAHKQGDWIPLYTYQLRQRKLANGELLEMHLKAADTSSLTLEAGITEKEWVLENNIQPIYYAGQLETMYDPVKKMEGEEGLYKVDPSGLYSLYYYLNNYIYFLPFMLLLFLVGGGLADERGKRETLHFLKTESITMKNLFNGKVAHSIFISLLSSVGFIMVVILIGMIFDRFGDWYYPILHYDSETIVEAANYSGNRPYSMNVGYHFIPLGEMLIRNGLLFISMIIFLVTLSQTIAIWVKNKLGVMASTIIIAIIGYVISIKQLFNHAHIIPFTYLDLSRVTNGELATMFDNPAINTQMGVVVLLVAAGILVVIGNLSLRKR